MMGGVKSDIFLMIDNGRIEPALGRHRVVTFTRLILKDKRVTPFTTTTKQRRKVKGAIVVKFWVAIQSLLWFTNTFASCGQVNVV